LQAALEGAVRDHRKTPEHRFKLRLRQYSAARFGVKVLARFLFGLIISHSYQTDKNI
jgi:hypothetical protein